MDDVVVVMATWNEAATIAGLLSQLSCPVIVIDDSSPDGTSVIASRYPQVTLLSRPVKQGVASAYLLGLRTALTMDTRYIVQMDAGGTHDPYQVGVLTSLADLTGADLVIGSRFMRPVWRGMRTVVSLGAALLMRSLGVPVHDATSGFRCWRTSFLRQMDLDAVQAQGFAFQLELLHQTHQKGGCITELPICYRLTSSTFNKAMLWEGCRTWWRLARHRGGA